MRIFLELTSLVRVATGLERLTAGRIETVSRAKTMPDHPTDQPKTHKVSFQLDAETFAKLKEIADKELRHVNTQVRWVVLNWLKDQ